MECRVVVWILNGNMSRHNAEETDKKVDRNKDRRAEQSMTQHDTAATPQQTTATTPHLPRVCDAAGVAVTEPRSHAEPLQLLPVCAPACRVFSD